MLEADEHHRPRPPGRALRTAIAALSVAGLLATTGCESLLDVEADPEEVPAEQLDDPTSLDARLVGAQADFFLAYDMFVAWTGLFTDELTDGTGAVQVDERRVTSDNGAIGAADENPEGIDGLWTPLQRAAFTSNLLQEDILADNFSERIPNPEESSELALVSMLEGYAKMTLGEAFCSTAFDGTGPELTSQETFSEAEQAFTTAIEAEGAAADVRRAALVGRARARMHLGDDGGAASDASQVPVDWAFVADVYASNSQLEENDLWNMLTDSQRFSVDPAYRALTIDDTSEDDPRIEDFQDPNDQFAIDGSTPLFQLHKYRSSTAPIVLASGFEAQYYLAEVQGGQDAVEIINDLRDRVGTDGEDGDGRGQGDLAAHDFSSSDGEEILLKIADERARSFFLEGKRMGDSRRYLDRHGIDLFPDTPGDQTCMPLPDAERETNPDL